MFILSLSVGYYKIKDFDAWVNHLIALTGVNHWLETDYFSFSLASIQITLSVRPFIHPYVCPLCSWAPIAPRNTCLNLTCENGILIPNGSNLTGWNDGWSDPQSLGVLVDDLHEAGGRQIAAPILSHGNVEKQQNWFLNDESLALLYFVENILFCLD